MSHFKSNSNIIFSSIVFRWLQWKIFIIPTTILDMFSFFNLCWSTLTEPKQKQHPVVGVTGDENAVWCCKEQCCLGTWNVRSTNEGKLEVIKQEMTRVNVNIVGISKLRWTGMGEFNSDDHYIYYCGQESLRRNRIAIIINKRVRNAVLGCNLKNDRMISLHSQGKPFNIRVIQVCPDQ